MSWSEYICTILAQSNRSEKNVVHSCAKSLYVMFEKGYSVNDAIIFIRGGRV